MPIARPHKTCNVALANPLSGKTSSHTIPYPTTRASRIWQVFEPLLSTSAALWRWASFVTIQQLQRLWEDQVAPALLLGCQHEEQAMGRARWLELILARSSLLQASRAVTIWKQAVEMVAHHGLAVRLQSRERLLSSTAAAVVSVHCARRVRVVVGLTTSFACWRAFVVAVDARGLLADMQQLQAEARARRCVCLLGNEVASHLTMEQTHPAAT